MIKIYLDHSGPKLNKKLIQAQLESPPPSSSTADNVTSKECGAAVFSKVFAQLLANAQYLTPCVLELSEKGQENCGHIIIAGIANGGATFLLSPLNEILAFFPTQHLQVLHE